MATQRGAGNLAQLRQFSIKGPEMLGVRSVRKI